MHEIAAVQAIACLRSRSLPPLASLCEAGERTGERDIWSAGIPHTKKSHDAFCLACMTRDKARHKWGLTFQLAKAERQLSPRKDHAEELWTHQQEHIGFPWLLRMHGN